jgi:broad specificity phosphatase PhoE
VRAKQSALEIADVIGFEPDDIIEEDLFNERECGEAVGMKNNEIKRLYPGADGFDRVPGAELTEELQARAAAMAAYLEQFKVDTVLAVGHGVTGRAIARHYAGKPFTEEFDRPTRDKVNLKNGQIMRLSPGPVELLPLDQ